MENAGARDMTSDLVKYYLTNNHQVIKRGQYVSDAKKTEFGVPQGSIIGPTLFIFNVLMICWSLLLMP